MEQNIKLGGVVVHPSDHICQDGLLDTSLNAVVRDGTVKAIPQPTSMHQFEEYEKLLYIHSVPNHTFYIVADTTNDGLKYTEDLQREVDIDDVHNVANISKVTSIGNTLLILYKNGDMVYVLWKHDKYITLVQDLPALKAEPFIDTMQLPMKSILDKFGFEEKVDNDLTGDDLILESIAKKLRLRTIDTYKINGANREAVAEKLFAAVNACGSTLKKNGFFYEPFFVRFALKLFDGTYTKHTEPVLLIPNSWGGPLMGVEINKDNKSLLSLVFSVAKLFASIEVEGLDGWDDIIKSICVFVSPPIIGYTDSAESIVDIRKLPYKEFVGTSWLTMADNEGGPLISYRYNNTNRIAPINKIAHKDIYNTTVGKETETVALNFNGKKLIVALFLGEIPDDGVVDEDRFPKISMTTEQEVADATPLTKDITSKTSVITIRDNEFSGEYIDLPHGVYQVATLNLDDYPETNTYIIRLGEQCFVYTITGPDEESAAWQKDVCFYINTKRTDGLSLNDAVTSAQTFHLVSEIPIASLKERKYSGAIKLKDSVLYNLSTKAALSDIGRSNTIFASKDVFSYNNRLNYVVGEETFLPGSSLRAINPPKYDSEDLTEILHAFVEIKQNSQIALIEIPIVEGEGEKVPTKDLFYFTFQRNSASKLIVYYKNKNDEYYAGEIVLNEHEFLNQSYAFNNFKPLKIENVQAWDGKSLPTTYDTIKIGNQIRTSEVDNPFVFSEERTTDIPTEEIYAVSTAAKPLSEGQFGQFPLYAFTSDGVWAMQTMDDGTYVARQPISQDVCTNPEAITQLDTSVIFPTQRGLMMLSGANAECISDAIDTPYPFNVHELPHYGDLAMALGWGDDEYEIKPFMEFAQEAKAIYNYAAQQIIYYNPNQDYAYVFDLGSRTWGMMQSDIAYNINAYPLAMAVTNDNELVEFVKPDKDSKYNEQRLLTRPIKLGGPDVLKTIDTIIARGRFSKGEVKLVLYGSRDLENWRIIKTSKTHRITVIAGTPYKYFRILIIANMDGDSNMTSLSVDFMPRYNNKLR